MTLQHREYECIDPADMVDDPANYAREQFMFGSSDTVRKAVGAWRWPLLHADKVADKLTEWLLEADRVIDYGGAAGPLGYGALIVDRIADVRGLEEVEGQVDLIFTAHTLEHIADIGLVLCSFHWKLRPGGRVVALVPSYTNEMLRAENWPYHAHTFCLTASTGAPAAYTRLDALFMQHAFDVHMVAEGYDNLIIFAEKK